MNSTFNCDLEPEIDPPSRLGRRVERSLRARGRLAPHTPAWFRLASAAAAAAVLLAGGYWLGAAAGGPGDAAETGSVEARYVLLLYEDEDFRPAADEEALVAEYGQWAGGLARKGSLVSGEKLDEAGMLLEMPGGAGTMLPGGDHGSPLGRLGGYFVISAADRAEAVAIAGTSPHLRHGGRIVVRPIDPT